MKEIRSEKSRTNCAYTGFDFYSITVEICVNNVFDFKIYLLGFE